ncbi:prepilin-type N-terminal cleavage/methylation domain-containing protein [Diplocloster modestus]|uniref:Prepilin-type N-terminal cleavage/methylation domain-containing protein n=1 Tax=Diplocloster modestus TaxID=2850322 RepID=A0ABS6K4K7_9FIRM|nr:prepilin-type N-terminal cleavage/methylation domain-containing protein [Diplocloster modestus]MBU9725427.1 prepilin-type N-terminal cleavage/methylation domain-containing protein [Diplocloster modestus]
MRKNQEGSTLVEVLVSFSILMLCMAMMWQSVVFSGKLSQKAEEIWKKTEAASNAYYTGQDGMHQTVRVNMFGEDMGEADLGVTKTDQPADRQIYYIND